MKIDSKHEKSTEAIAAYRVIRDDMKPAPNKPKAEKKAKAEKKPATKKAAAKKPAKKAKKASGKAKSKEPVAPEDGFWDDNE
jgi:DNA topoisomerase-1